MAVRSRRQTDWCDRAYFWGGWLIPQRTVRAVRIVVALLVFDEDLASRSVIEEFPVQQLIPQIPVKGLDISVLPRTARLDE